MRMDRITAATNYEGVMTRFLFLLVCAVFLVCSGATILFAQTGTATLSGTIMDPSGKVVPDAEVSITNVDTGVARVTKTNGDGIYVLPALQPGHYRVIVTKPGFKQVALTDVTLNTQDSISRNFNLEVGAVSETVNVSANNDSMQTDSPAVSMTVTREFVENVPLNGRSFQDLIQLAPGSISANGATGARGYNIDGQRTDANNFTVDGVSANLGGFLNSANGQDNGLGGTAPSQTVLGTTQSLVSIDALQEFKIQTSGYTAEYGRNPGGQISFTTRSGTNDIHGTLFEYLRNTAFDANSYLNDYYGYPKAAEHQNDYGGTVGGPVVIPKVYDGRDKTFFFISYERLQLLTPAFESEYVPTQAFRNWASPGIQPYLNSQPLPNPNSPGNQDGCTIPDPSTGLPTACDALFTRSYSSPSTLNNISVRLDQNLGQRFHIFLRYADTPSSVISGLETLSSSQINAHTWTAGLTANISSTLVNELRFNYSHDAEGFLNTQQAIGGSIPLARDLLVPVAYQNTLAAGFFEAYVPSTEFESFSQFGGGGSVQHQYQIVDSLTWTRGSHSIKIGVDWRRLTPILKEGTYSSNVNVSGLAAIQQGYATSVSVANYGPGAPIFDNLSLYAEDHWRINARLSIDYGLRWEFNPPPGPSHGSYPVTLTSGNLATAQLTRDGSQPYETNYHSFAPRFGFAWNAIPSTQHALTVRGGFGIFYDTGQQTIGSAYGGAYPFYVAGPTLTNSPFPLSDGALAPPSLNVPLIPPYPFLGGLTSPSLTLPYTEQWNLSIDEALNSRNTLTVSYVGNEGRKLLFTGYYPGGAGSPINPDFAGGLQYTYNGSSSSYNALQVQDQGRIANGLDFVGSFTWAHALDNSSSNFGSFPAPFYGNSDNDLPLVLNLALNYQTPTIGSSRWERALTSGWVVANRFSTQSGYPLNVYQDQCIPLPNGGCQNYVPDLVPGAPIYLHGSAADVNGQPVPGSWRLNSAAFVLVPTDPTTGIPVRQGTLGRNYVRGPGFYALNTAVQRSFPIYEELHLIFRVDAFNILNHPNLDFPDTGLSDSTFGQLVGNGAGAIRTIGVPNGLYAMGAPRSLQLSLKLQF
jgi:hypothetical protein